MAENEKGTFVKQIPLQREYPTDLQSNFVSNLVIQHQPHAFILSFFEVWPPPIVGETDEEKREQVEQIESVKATCVARLVVTPDKMKDFLDTMQENYEQYEEMMGEMAEQSDSDR
jgi:hypothetical protein